MTGKAAGIFCAIDTPDLAAAEKLATDLQGVVDIKLGLEFFTAHGAAGVAKVRAAAGAETKFFLDLKFHDIPNTVAGAVRSAARLGARMMTVHAAGGPAMLTAARTAIAGLHDAPELLAVTVLTSMDAAQLAAAGVQRTPAEQVSLLARMGCEAGLRGFVCSPQEVAAVRTLTGPEGVLVVPGIRPAGSDAGDQKRLATPSAALRDGASYLVVGRPITQAADPVGAADAIVAEMAAALAV